MADQMPEREKLSNGTWLAVVQKGGLWSVWLDPNQDEDGICLARRCRSRRRAIESAAATLQLTAKELRAKVVKP